MNKCKILLLAYIISSLLIHVWSKRTAFLFNITFAHYAKFIPVLEYGIHRVSRQILSHPNTHPPTFQSPLADYSECHFSNFTASICIDLYLSLMRKPAWNLHSIILKLFALTSILSEAYCYCCVLPCGIISNNCPKMTCDVMCFNISNLANFLPPEGHQCRRLGSRSLGVFHFLYKLLERFQKFKCQNKGF
jgi:hypothetical protein